MYLFAEKQFVRYQKYKYRYYYGLFVTVVCNITLCPCSPPHLAPTCPNKLNRISISIIRQYRDNLNDMLVMNFKNSNCTHVCTHVVFHLDLTVANASCSDTNN